MGWATNRWALVYKKNEQGWRWVEAVHVTLCLVTNVKSFAMDDDWRQSVISSGMSPQLLCLAIMRSGDSKGWVKGEAIWLCFWVHSWLATASSDTQFLERAMWEISLWELSDNAEPLVFVWVNQVACEPDNEGTWLDTTTTYFYQGLPKSRIHRSDLKWTEKPRILSSLINYYHSIL